MPSLQIPYRLNNARPDYFTHQTAIKEIMIAVLTNDVPFGESIYSGIAVPGYRETEKEWKQREEANEKRAQEASERHRKETLATLVDVLCIYGLVTGIWDGRYDGEHV